LILTLNLYYKLDQIFPTSLGKACIKGMIVNIICIQDESYAVFRNSCTFITSTQLIKPKRVLFPLQQKFLSALSAENI
jgi:hypothetical protein